MSTLSTFHLGAIGLGTMIFNFLYWNFGFLRMGTTGLTAQAYGAADKSKQVSILLRGLALSLLLSILLLILAPVLAGLLFALMNADTNTLPLVRTYYFICLTGIPAMLCLFTMKGWFFGMQNAFSPLWITIIINLVNIALSYLLVIQFNMGIAGVAIGTVIAQWFGVLFALFILAKKYQISFGLVFHFKKWWKSAELISYMSFNTNLFVRTIALTIVFGIVYSRGALFGVEILAANVVLLQMLNWMSYAIDGFAYAAESLTGKFFGSANYTSMLKTIRYSLVWGFGLALIFSLAYLILGNAIMGVLIKEDPAFTIASSYVFWMVILPVVGFLSYIWDGVFSGLTDAKSLRDTMILAFIGFILMLWLTESRWQNHGLWASLLFFLFIRGVYQTYLYIRLQKSLKLKPNSLQ
jgi:MATE family multidrug resistance protein